MTITDITRKKTISNKIKIADSFSDRLLGLLNPHNPRFLVLKTRFGIHTFFMKTSIDVLLLDNEQKVVKIHKKLTPNQLFLYQPRYSTIIEMPQGTIEKFNIKINDKISIE